MARPPWGFPFTAHSQTSELFPNVPQKFTKYSLLTSISGVILSRDLQCVPQSQPGLLCVCVSAPISAFFRADTSVPLPYPARHRWVLRDCAWEGGEAEVGCLLVDSVPPSVLNRCMEVMEGYLENPWQSDPWAQWLREREQAFPSSMNQCHFMVRAKPITGATIPPEPPLGDVVLAPHLPSAEPLSSQS